MTDNIGILDPEGKNPNPLTGNPYSDDYRKLAEKWTKVPIYKRANEIIDMIKEYQVMLIISSTGSGKTILTPKFAAHALNYKGRIVTTLPKQMTAKSAAEFAAKTLDVKLGEEVGYQYKGSEKNAKSAKTKLLYATDGTVVARLLKDPKLTDFDAVIIDEAHERKVQIDFMLYLLRRTLEVRPELKVIIMSATINEQIFASYFSSFKFAKIDVGGERLHPIKSIFLKESITQAEYLDKGYDILKKILKEDDTSKSGAHDIIFFAPSVADALDICRRTTADKLDVYCIEVYSGMPSDREELAMHKDKYKQYGKNRKLIVATGVAESSLTFDGLKYVIDSGYEFYGYYDPEIDARVLNKSFITQAQAKQRMGRAGRTEPGICYHLYTENEFNNKMEKYPEPNIRVSNIYQECLSLLSYPQVDTIEKLLDVLSNFIEPPKEVYIRSAINQLKYLNLIDNEKITKLGQIVNGMQMDPMMAVSIYAARLMKCSNEVILILSTIETAKNNISEIFHMPKHDKEKMDKFYVAKRKFEHKSGDHLSIYEVMSKYAEMIVTNEETKLKKFISDNFLNKKVIEKSYKYYKKYKGSLMNTFKTIPELETLKDKTLEQKVLSALAYGYKYHMGFLRDKVYSTSKADKIKLSRSTFLDNRSLPQTIFYSELFSSNGRLEINIASKITPKVDEIVSTLNDHIQQLNSN